MPLRLTTATWNPRPDVYKRQAADGVSEQIRNFVVPLCANIHMAGSMITITACATAGCLMNQLPISLATVVPFIMTLGVAMVASPGAPGGSIMTALPFLYMIFGAEAGDPNGPICACLLYTSRCV